MIKSEARTMMNEEMFYKLRAMVDACDMARVHGLIDRIGDVFKDESADDCRFVLCGVLAALIIRTSADSLEPTQELIAMMVSMEGEVDVTL
jgi:hypothetical protein